jgi:hypothetical protein
LCDEQSHKAAFRFPDKKEAGVTPSAYLGSCGDVLNLTGFQSDWIGL